LVELASQDHEGWQTPARRVNTLDRCYPLSVTWLYDSRSTNRVSASDNFERCSDPHHKPSLIKVVCVLMEDTPRLARVLYKLEPRADLDRIFTSRAL
jgi:hypothetical protein